MLAGSLQTRSGDRDVVQCPLCPSQRCDCVRFGGGVEGRMNLDRLGGGTFDFTVKTRKKKQYDVAVN